MLVLVLFLGHADSGTRGALLAWGGFAAAALTGAAIGVIVGLRGLDDFGPADSLLNDVEQERRPCLLVGFADPPLVHENSDLLDRTIMFWRPRIARLRNEPP